MKKKIRNFLSNNLGFKLLSVALAFMLWLMVYNTEDPDVTRTFTCNVTIENAETIADAGKCYEIINGTGTVTFAVTAQRSIIDKLDETDFTVTADMNNLVEDENQESGTVPVEMSVVSRYSSSVKFKSKNKKIEVALENLETKQFIVTADYIGEVHDGYALGEVIVESPNVLKVSGPESVVDTIGQVVATIDVAGMSQNLVDNVIPVLYDSDGNKLSQGQLNRLTLSNSTVTISAGILATRQVSLAFGWSGTPAAESTVIGVEASQDAVEVKGPAAILDALNEIEIPDSVLKVDGASEDVSVTVDISAYLPEEVTLVNDSDAQVTVTALIETHSTKTLTVPTSAITIQGLAYGWAMSFEGSAFNVTAAGTDANLAKLSASDIKGTIDVSELVPGTYIVPVQLNLDEQLYNYATVHVTVTITGAGNAE